MGAIKPLPKPASRSAANAEQTGKPSTARQGSPSVTTSPRDLFWRLHQAVGPIAGGVLLDVVDLATLGPIGLALGLFVGAGVGWWIASIYQFSSQTRLVWSALAALYCTIPFTAIVPLATMISAVARFERDAPECAGDEVT